jgi:4-diphosphocytidyl-2-C-methyl-D-erythritol kinase
MLKEVAPAKINLGLHVLRKRADGYHDLETVFIRIPWVDTLSVTPAESLALTCSDPGLPVDESNLCMKAAIHLAATSGAKQGAALHLEKHVPYGAGLGGGSSDAAATLRLLAGFWGLTVTDAELHSLAASIGSDVPFFLMQQAAYATGRGEILEPLLDQAGGTYALPYPLVVVVPPVEISTASAYRLVRPSEAGRPDLRSAVRSNDLERWRREVVNDFEAPVFEAYPAVSAVKDMMVDAGAGYASLSGSGSAVFGIFEDMPHAQAAAEAALQNGHQAWYGFATS